MKTYPIPTLADFRIMAAVGESNQPPLAELLLFYAEHGLELDVSLRFNQETGDSFVLVSNYYIPGSQKVAMPGWKRIHFRPMETNFTAVKPASGESQVEAAVREFTRSVLRVLEDRQRAIADGLED